MPYYQVRTKFEFDGFFYQKDDYKGLALLQHDFEQDYKQYQKAQQKVKANIEEFQPGSRLYFGQWFLENFDG